jgi:diadenylate cyclase
MIWPWEPLSASTLLRAAWQAIRAIGWVDTFDIATVTLLIYLAISWIRRARTIRILQGMLITALVYLAALRMGLTLTTSVFRSLSTIMALTLMSLFQEDFRRFFERLGGHRPTPMRRRDVEVIAQTVWRLARARTGAILVLKGKDLLERHLSGGQALGGRLSGALVESIFDPHSDGHDGAVIIEGELVTRFGVHLPLSKNIDHDSGLGTRHAAALGLSEITDALCIVVSEQRGTVMVAGEGRLTRVAREHQLEDRIRASMHQTSASPRNRRWRGLTARAFDKTLALAAGVALWLVMVKGVYPVGVSFVVPIRAPNVPPALHIEELSPSRVQVTMKGLARDLRGPAPERWGVELDLHRARRGTTPFPLAPRMVKAVEGAVVVSVSPMQVKASLRGVRSRPASGASNAHHVWFHL